MSGKFLSIVNPLKWHLFTLLEQRALLFTATGINFFNGIISARQLSDFGVLSTPSLGDTLFFVYAGPGIGVTNVIIVSTWLLNQLFFLLAFARLINEQTNTSDYSILLRVASRTRWLWGIFASMITYAFFYTSLLIFCALAGIGFQQGWEVSSSLFFQDIGIWGSLSQLSFTQVFGLVWLSLFSSFVVQGLLMVLLMLRVQKIIWGLFVILALALLVWLLGIGETIHTWQIWLPATHFIVSRHYPFEIRLPMLTFGFSYIYNAVLGIIFLIATTITIKRSDFLGDSHDNQ